MKGRFVWLVALSFALGACATSPRSRAVLDGSSEGAPWALGAVTQDESPDVVPTRKKTRNQQILIHYTVVDLGSFTFDLRDFQLPEPVLDEAEFVDGTRTVSELRYRVGGEGGFFVSLLGDTFEEDEFEVGGTTVLAATDFDQDLFGLALGYDGFSTFGDSDVAFALDYSLGVGFEAGEGNIAVFDTGSGQFLELDDADVTYFTADGRVGPGMDLNGIQVAAGLIVSYISASWEHDAEVNTIDGEASNAGGYARAWYRSDASPITGGVEAYFGDISGFGFGVGLNL